jgi:hypothetical protein
VQPSWTAHLGTFRRRLSHEQSGSANLASLVRKDPGDDFGGHVSSNVGHFARMTDALSANGYKSRGLLCHLTYWWQHDQAHHADLSSLPLV